MSILTVDIRQIPPPHPTPHGSMGPETKFSPRGASKMIQTVRKRVKYPLIRPHFWDRLVGAEQYRTPPHVRDGAAIEELESAEPNEKHQNLH